MQFSIRADYARALYSCRVRRALVPGLPPSTSLAAIIRTRLSCCISATCMYTQAAASQWRHCLRSGPEEQLARRQHNIHLWRTQGAGLLPRNTGGEAGCVAERRGLLLLLLLLRDRVRRAEAEVPSTPGRTETMTWPKRPTLAGGSG